MGSEKMKSGYIHFKENHDERGTLIAVESAKNIPFAITRVFYLYNLKAGVNRGRHAMKKSKQVMICMNGSCDVSLDDGYERKEFSLSSKDTGLFIEKMVWHEMKNFSDDCVLMVLTDSYYDPGDNEWDYNKFKNQLTVY